MDFAAARENMIEGQLRPNRVTDEQILSAMGTVPRERFLPNGKRAVAYVDEDIGLGQGRFLMEPIVLARLIQAAGVGPDDLVLDIGCGTGYSAAILALLANTVIALECDERLARQATEILAERGHSNVVVIEGGLEKGCPDQGPFDVILIDGAVAAIPPAITDLLADGGRLVTVVRDETGLGRATLMARRGEVLAQRILFDAAVPLLPGFEPKVGFVF